MFALQLSNLGFSPLLPSIQQEFGMSYTQLGTFTGMYGLLAMVLSVPAGVSAKRFGERRVLAARTARRRGGQPAARRSVERRVGDRVSRPDDLRLPVRLRQRAHRGGAHGAAGAARPHHGRASGRRRRWRRSSARRSAACWCASSRWRTAILGYAGMAALGAVVFWLCYRPVADGDACPRSRMTPAAVRASARSGRPWSGCWRSSSGSADSGSSP